MRLGNNITRKTPPISGLDDPAGTAFLPFDDAHKKSLYDCRIL